MVIVFRFFCFGEDLPATENPRDLGTRNSTGVFIAVSLPGTYLSDLTSRKTWGMIDAVPCAGVSCVERETEGARYLVAALCGVPWNPDDYIVLSSGPTSVGGILMKRWRTFHDCFH